jgi:hypothetical protein
LIDKFLKKINIDNTTEINATDVFTIIETFNFTNNIHPIKDPKKKIPNLNLDDTLIPFIVGNMTLQEKDE